ncbi:hypothetical protein [Veillonella rogosae]|uniref:hypothetical protein n=1 Tax=Veillonella rogosae TaxID=423477 RepID=UPI000A9D8BFB|nr:hypothetical protein [Veillonella rogosae]
MEVVWKQLGIQIWGALIVAPFKRGIPQIVEHGSCKKGFYATAAFALVSFLFSNILPSLVSMIFADNLRLLSLVRQRYLVLAY